MSAVSDDIDQVGRLIALYGTYLGLQSAESEVPVQLVQDWLDGLPEDDRRAIGALEVRAELVHQETVETFLGTKGGTG